MASGNRYRPLYISLHWISALLVFGAFLIGLVSLVKLPNTGQKLVPLTVHVGLGISILVLTIIRIVVRSLMGRPVHRLTSLTAPGKKSAPLLDRLSIYVQPLLYLCTFLMAVVGIAIAIPADLFAILFFGKNQPLPPDFYVFPARIWHGTISLVLMLLIVQHILVFVYHQFLRGENFIGRMWFAPKSRPKD